MRRLRNVPAVLRFFLFLLSGCCLFSSIIFAEEKEYVKPRLAVVVFDTKNVDEATVQAVTELVQSRFENSDLYVMVERSQVEKVFKEQVFQYSGSVDEATAIKIGKMLGASKLVLGSINSIDKSFMISGRVVDVETGQIEIAANEYSRTAVDLKDSVEELVKSLVQKDRSRFQSYLERTAPERETIQLYVTGASNYIKHGTAARIITKNDYFSSYSGTYQVEFASMKDDTVTSKLGGGLRYFFLGKYFLDLGYAGPVGGSAKFKVNSQAYNLRMTYGTQFSGSINRLWPIAKKVSMWGGAGFIHSSYQMEFLGIVSPEIFTNGGDTVSFYPMSWFDKESHDVMLYTLTTGLEWKPLSRFGVSFAVSYVTGSIPAGYITGSGSMNSGADYINFPIQVFAPEVQPLVVTLMTSLSF